MPLGDWQFWVVTLAGLLGALVVGRTLTRMVRGPRRGRRVNLTIGQSNQPDAEPRRRSARNAR